MPSIEDIALSPSGEELAMVAKIKGERKLLVLNRPGDVRAIAPLGDRKLRYILWAGNDIVYLVTSATENLGYGFTTDKVEVQGALVVPLDGGKAELVFARTPSLANAIWGNYGTRFIDGQWLGYFGGIEFQLTADRTGYFFDHGRPALFTVDLKNNKPRKLAKAPPEGHDRDWLVDGQGKAAISLDIDTTDGKWQIANERNTVLASGVAPLGDVSLISFGYTGTSVIYSLTDQETGGTQWYEVPLAGGTPHEILDDVDVEDVYIDKTNGHLLGYLDAATSKPVLFDPAQQKVLSMVYRAFPNRDVEIEDWTPSFSHVLVRTSGNEDSGTWFLVDMAHLKADAIGYERPPISPAQVGPISTIDYKASDGLELDGILTLPPGREAKNLPVVLLPHGGPHTHDKLTFDWWAQAFASRGYAVFQPNFRGSTNRDMAFVRAGYGQWGRKMQTDISDGLAALTRLGIVDPKRACIMGASYGGYAALAGVTLQHGLYRCAVAVAPVSDLKDRYQTKYHATGNNKMVRRNLLEIMGDPKAYDEVSPRRHADKADAPVLLIHGKDDTVVPFNHSSAMADALKDAGKPYEMIVLREEDHWLSHAATRQQMLEEAMRFIQKYNPAD